MRFYDFRPKREFQLSTSFRSDHEIQVSTSFRPEHEIQISIRSQVKIKSLGVNLKYIIWVGI